MTRLLFATALILAAAAGRPQDAPSPMDKLSWMVGSWMGNGSITLGPGDVRKFHQVEEVTTKLGGVLITIDGLGVDADDQEKVVHAAFGVLAYDPDAKKYTFRPYLANGKTVEAKVEVADKKMEWSMDLTDVGTIRYTITLTPAGMWHEIGEMTRDKGKTYLKFFEMDLSKGA